MIVKFLSAPDAPTKCNVGSLEMGFRLSLAGTVRRTLASLLVIQMALGSAFAGAQGTVAPVAPVTDAQASQEAQSLVRALTITRSAEATLVTDVLGKPNESITRERLGTFSAVWARLTSANAEIGLVKNESDFNNWWNRRKSHILSKKSNLEASLSMQAYFVYVYSLYVIETKPEPAKELQEVVESPTLSARSAIIGAAVLGAVLTLGKWMGNIAYNATVLAVGGDLVRALTDKAISPTRQKFYLTGNKLGAPINAWQNRLYFREKTINENTDENVEKLLEKTFAARQGLAHLGYDADAAEVVSTLQKFQDMWNAAAQVWDMGNPEIFRHGRSNFNEPINRYRDHAHVILSAISAADGFKRGLEMKRYILSQGHAQAPLLDQKIRALQTLLTEVYELELAHDNDVIEKVIEHTRLAKEGKTTSAMPEVAEPQALVDKRAAAKLAERELTNLNVSDEDVKDIAESQRNFLAARRQAAAFLGMSLMWDRQYTEYSEKMPVEIQRIYLTFRSSFGIDYFHSIFRTEALAIANSVGVAVHDLQIRLQAERDAQLTNPGMAGRVRALTRRGRAETQAARERANRAQMCIRSFGG